MNTRIMLGASCLVLGALVEAAEDVTLDFSQEGEGAVVVFDEVEDDGEELGVGGEESGVEEDPLDLLDLEGVEGAAAFLPPHGDKNVAAPNVAVVTLDPSNTHPIPSTLYGLFFEDINHAADGGIYAELVANRGFDWRDEQGKLEGWTPFNLKGGAASAAHKETGAARISIQCGAPLHPNTAQHLRIESFGGFAGVRNDGYGGIAVEAGKAYDLSLYCRALDAYEGNVAIVLADKGMSNVLARTTLKNASLVVGPKRTGLDFKLPKWKKFTVTLRPKKTMAEAALFLLLDKPGAVEFEMVSLFPQDTFNGRKNGLRKDMVQMLKDIKPGVLRFPGGCIIEGHDFQHWYDWKRTVGPVERRESIWNTWGYWQSMGLGYYEYFCLAEDIGAEPLPIMLSGLTCQFRKEKLAPLSAMPYFAQNIIDLIDFANADPAENEWARLRAEMGHPEPFNLKFVGIGNENWDEIYLERYFAIYDIVHKARPGIKIVSSAGAGPGPGGVYEMAWKKLSSPKRADLIDEHFYVSPDWMLQQTRRYDDFDRNGPHVFAGEYACHVPGGSNTLYAALCEAAMMTGFERNSDVVDMATYAPLFNKEGWPGWKPDLIWFDNQTCYGTPNYYVQKLFGNNRPDTYVASTVEAAILAPRKVPTGRVGLRTWFTAVEVRNYKVTAPDGTVLLENPSLDDVENIPQEAAWREGRDSSQPTLAQTRTTTRETLIHFGDRSWRDYTVSCDFRKTGGKEGIIFIVRDGADGKNIALNLGGWNNTSSGIELHGYEGVKAPRNVPFTLETGRWYHIDITLDGSCMTVAIDGRKLYDRAKLRLPDLEDFFAATGFDTETGEYVIKLVNTAESERPVKIVWEGRNSLRPELPAGTVQRTVLTGAPGAINTISNPTNIAPVTDTFSFSGGSSLSTTLPPTSLTILRLKK